jgi:CRISPR-associated endonuclease Csn1
VNHYQKWIEQKDGTMKKEFTKQVKGDSWAIRKPLHKDTVSGLVNLQLKKTVSLSAAFDSFQNIVDKELRAKIKELVTKGNDKKKIVKFFKEQKNIFNDNDISRVEIYYSSNDNPKEKLAASRVELDESFNEKKIESVTDSGIQKILKKHLNNYKGIKDDKGKEITPESLAFSAEGIDALNKNIKSLNSDLFHQPIYKVRTYETLGNKFNVGISGNKKDKYVEAAKGTNLFFAIYVNEKGKRSFETIPLNVVIENQKFGAINKEKPMDCSVPQKNESGDTLLFSLSPNDLVYVPTEEEIEKPELVNFEKLNENQVKTIYKFVSSSGNQAFFIQSAVASSIVNKFEFSALNKMEKSVDDAMIKAICWKLGVNRLGKVVKVAM